jgi:hypothetical protein
MDPIGDFLAVRARLGDPPTLLIQHRIRIERFRRAYPALPLPELSPAELIEHLGDLERDGVPTAEIEETRSICRDFIDFKDGDKDPGAARRERSATTRELPFVSSTQIGVGAPRRVPSANPYARRVMERSAKGTWPPWLLWLTVLAALVVGYAVGRAHEASRSTARDGAALDADERDAG